MMHKFFLNESRLKNFEKVLKLRPKVILHQKKEGRACVLVPFLNVDGEGCLLFTRRAVGLSSHSDQMSFPGGYQEQQDGGDPSRTALRETEEEIGIAMNTWKILGETQQFYSLSGHVVVPVVGFGGSYMSQDDVFSKLTVNPSEVSQVVIVPLTHMFDERNVSSETLRSHKIIAKRYSVKEDVVVWGLTALITECVLKDFGKAFD